MTLHDRCKRFLVAQGAVEVETKTRKYTAMRFDGDKQTAYYFLGKSGAVRINNRNVITDAISITDRFMKRVELHEQVNKLSV